MFQAKMTLPALGLAALAFSASAQPTAAPKAAGPVDAVCVTNSCMPKSLEAEVAQLIQQRADARKGWNDCIADTKAKTGIDLATMRIQDFIPNTGGPPDPAAGRAAMRDHVSKTTTDGLGAARGAQCTTFYERATGPVSREEQRANAVAAGDVNQVRWLDGLPPLGPDRIAVSQIGSYSDQNFAPGQFRPTRYVNGFPRADGTIYLYRTPELLAAAVGAGEEPAATLGRPPPLPPPPTLADLRAGSAP